MKFLSSGDLSSQGLLKLILLLTLLFLTFLHLTNTLIYIEKAGLSYTSVVEYYLGSEGEFKNPVSYRGLLEGTHFHIFSMAMVLLMLNHLAAFTGFPHRMKLLLIIVSFGSGFMDIASGWLIRFSSPVFAYMKIFAFAVFQLSFLVLLILSFFSLRVYDRK